MLRYRWPVLKQLHLQACALTAQDINVLSQANELVLPCIQKIDLGENPGISGTLAVLLRSPWPELQVLAMNGCSLTAEDAYALISASKDGRLKERMVLIISRNKIPSVEMQQLKEYFVV